MSRIRVTSVTCLLALAITGCTSAPEPTPPRWSGAAAPSSSAAPELPTAAPYRVPDGEPGAAVKKPAVTYLEREFASAAGQVIYPQLGGLTKNAASVMALVRVHDIEDGHVTTSTRTVDVRLTRTASRWTVTRLAFDGSKPSAGSDDPPTPAATEVLSEARLTMSDTTRADIRAGVVDERILQSLLTLSRTWPISVTALDKGHPSEVFGTDRRSNHNRGRAVDIWAVDGEPVAQQRAGDSPARQAMLLALRSGATEVGGPWVVTAGGRTSFTNALHQDHLHIGYE